MLISPLNFMDFDPCPPSPHIYNVLIFIGDFSSYGLVQAAYFPVGFPCYALFVFLFTNSSLAKVPAFKKGTWFQLLII